MPSKVTLVVTDGPLAGNKYGFDERMACVIGRGATCILQIPKDGGDGVSRHHCLVDINPPHVTVQDLGSRNGTYLNGVKIGERARNQDIDDVRQDSFDTHSVHDGDIIKISQISFQVKIQLDVKCVSCNKNIPYRQQHDAQIGPDAYQCNDCQAKALIDSATRIKTEKFTSCSQCGRDVRGEPGATGCGDYICVKCRSRTVELVTELLKTAKHEAPEGEMAAIKGYKVINEIGKGGMGAVYLAQNEKTGDNVALKVMLPGATVDQAAKNDFLREMTNTKALDHPNIVKVMDSGYCSGAFFFTLEYCEGGSVQDLMTKRAGSVLPPEEAVQVILQVLDGLEYAHTQAETAVVLESGEVRKVKGLVHRDLKPGNIFLKGFGSTRISKIADFGLSKSFECAGLTGCTSTGAFSGTLSFISRQQFLDFKYAKPEVDVWAAAATLYFMMTRRPPRQFAGKNPFKVILETAPVPIQQRRPSIPKKLAKVIDHALDDSKKLAFQSAAELREAVRRAAK